MHYFVITLKWAQWQLALISFLANTAMTIMRKLLVLYLFSVGWSSAESPFWFARASSSFLKLLRKKKKKTKALIIRWHIVEAVGTNVSLHFWFLRLSSFSSGSTWMNWCRKKSECWTEQGACQQRSCETRWTTNTSHSRAALNYTCERMRANTPKQRKPLKPLKAYFHNNHSFAYKSCSRLIIYVGRFMLYCWSGRSSIKSFYLRK